MSALHTMLQAHGIDPAAIRCGAGCGDGWVSIIDRLLVDLGRHGPFKLDQIKEKFGGLRVYLADHNEGHEALIRWAERVCWATCELCGKRGEKRDGGWIRVLCNGCAVLR